MKNNLKISLLSVLTLLFLFAGSAQAQPLPGRWSAEKANNWYKQYPWLSGCDYIPANAINQIEMWSNTITPPSTRNWVGHSSSASRPCACS